MEHGEELGVREGYALWASCYDEDGNPLIALEEPVVRRWLGDLRGRRALDLGCGTGRLTRALTEAGASVTALDMTPEMLSRAREKLRGQSIGWVRYALPSPLPFRDETFDLIVLGLVIEHIAELSPVLVESARVLVPGGRIIMSVLHPDRTAEGQRARFIDPETGLRRPIRTLHRTLDDYRNDASSAGLRLVDETTLTVPAGLAERLPRAARYVGLALGWVGCWIKRD